MDDLEGAKRMGREGQQPFNLSIQEKNAFDQGKRERDQMLNGGFTNQGGGGGGGAGIGLLFLLALIAPAFAAPGLALWALWTHFQTTQGWEWPVLTAICVGAGIAMLVIAKQLWDRTPAVLLALVLSLYLGVSYGLCMPMIFSTDIWWTSVTAVGTAAVGFWAGLNAPNRWLSSFVLTTAAALALGVFLNLFALEIVFPTGAPLYVAMALKWAGAGLALGAILRLVARFKFGVLILIALIGAGLFLAPSLLGDIANFVLSPPEPTYTVIES
jgi:hypothetical protein